MEVENLCAGKSKEGRQVPVSQCFTNFLTPLKKFEFFLPSVDRFVRIHGWLPLKYAP